MSKELFDKLTQMSVEELIALSKASEDNGDDKEFDQPLTAHETALYFRAKGTLTAEEFNALMKSKLSELLDTSTDSDKKR